jgi:hypothetical protein
VVVKCVPSVSDGKTHLKFFNLAAVAVVRGTSFHAQLSLILYKFVKALHLGGTGLS